LKVCPKCKGNGLNPSFFDEQGRLQGLGGPYGCSLCEREGWVTPKEHAEYLAKEAALAKNFFEKEKARKPKSAGRKPRVSKQSLSEQLAQLAELKDAGALTAEEFKLAKQHLLKSPKPPAAGSTTRKNQKK
jgi:hypothetical protein